MVQLLSFLYCTTFSVQIGNLSDSNPLQTITGAGFLKVQPKVLHFLPFSQSLFVNFFLQVASFSNLTRKWTHCLLYLKMHHFTVCFVLLYEHILHIHALKLNFQSLKCIILPNSALFFYRHKVLVCMSKLSFQSRCLFFFP